MPSVVFPHSQQTVSITIDGEPAVVPAGITVAAAVLLAGASHIRTTPVSNEERAPCCHMGVCFECLAEIDGVPNKQGCLVTVTDGMRIRKQEGAPQFSGEGKE